MKFIFEIIKGIFIGVANIIPGVSGGTMAVSMGVYDKLIGSINRIFKEFKKSFLTLLPLAIGMVVGIGAFSFILPYSLTHYAFPTCMCFAGLIVGGIPEIINNTSDALKKENKKLNPVHIIAFLLLIAFAVWMALANGDANTNAETLDINFVNIIILFAIGLVAAATMIIPGVSGSLILMILGYYTAIMSSISGALTALKDMDIGALMHYVLILLPFAIGCVLGIILISKLISWLFKRFESVTYCAILGLITASPFAIFYKMTNATFGPVSIIVGIVLFVAAAAFTYIFSLKTKKL